MSTVLRITPQTMGTATDVYDAAIDFDDHEVLRCVRIPDHQMVLQKNQKYLPKLFDEGEGVSVVSISIFKIDIWHYYQTTKAKVDSVYAYTRLFKVYWKYNLDPAEYKLCLLKPSYDEEYKFGKQAAEVTTPMQFNQSYHWS